MAIYNPEVRISWIKPNKFPLLLNYTLYIPQNMQKLYQSSTNPNVRLIYNISVKRTHEIMTLDEQIPDTQRQQKWFYCNMHNAMHCPHTLFIQTSILRNVF